MLREAGYIAFYIIHDASKHGIPHRRFGVWIVAVLSPHVLTDDMLKQVQTQAAELDQELQQEAPRLETHMSAENTGSGCVRQTLERKAVLLRNDNRKFREWQATHRQHWSRVGYARPPRQHPVAAQFIEQWPLTPREADCLNYICCKHAPGADYVLCCDLPQSINRIPRALNKATCITPNSKIVAMLGRDFVDLDPTDAPRSRPLL